MVRLRLGLVAAGWLACAAGAQVPMVLPSAIVFDAQGNLYFAETGNHVVRRFSTAGVTTTVAGTGVQGFSGDGAAAVAAELDSPAGLAIDAVGDLLIADTHNYRVRKVSAVSGIIATVAGTGAAGFSGDGGAATAARLDWPTALAIDAAGNVYVADTDNHRVRRIAVGSGLMTTVAGDGVERFAGDGGLATAASLDSPNGLAVDAAGNLYLADTHNGRVREVSVATGVISTVAGTGQANFSGDGGAATAAGLALPRGLTIDAAGNIYVADSANHRVRRISSTGTIATVAGQGTQAFLGDDAPAVAASLDSPHGLAISPAGLLTLADRDNQRIRQNDALPTPGPDIHTLAGVGNPAVVTLSLSGPAVATYGGGAVTANLIGGGTGTGDVTFFDTVAGRAIQLGVAVLSGGSATFSTAQLGAGVHSVVASYAGDASHAAAQSSALSLTVTQLSLTAAANPASILYGQAVPTSTGTVSGALAQDAGKVSAVFASTAGALSPVGVYPIYATLTGSAAANYSLGATAGGLTIAQAPTLITMSPLAGVVLPGVPIAVNLQVASTTSGVPTGSVTLMDATAVLGVVPLSVGSAAFSTSTLGMGTHSLSAVYFGDSNFLGVTSGAAVVTVAAASPDFTLASVGTTSQSVPAGSTAAFQFAVAMQGGAMSSPILLAVQGAPVGAIASLTPALLPPGGSVTSFTLTIQTPFAELDRPSRPGSFGGATVLALLLMPFAGAMSKRYHFRVLVLLGAGWGLLFATGCGNRVNTSAETTNARSYTITVTGTGTSSAGTALQHSANVTLKVL